MENTIKLYTDGSCNGHIGGYAVVLAGLEDEIPKSYNHLINSGGKMNTTNNEMELMGIQKAVEFAKDIITENKIIIFSDSEYSVKSCTIWYKNWQKNGWKTNARKPVKNQELIRNIIHILEENPRIKLQHVKGHDGNKWNEFADDMANQAREIFQDTHSSLDEDKMCSKLFNKLNALHTYTTREGERIIAFKEIDAIIIKELNNMGFKNIKISGIWKENFGENKGEYVEIICKRG